MSADERREHRRAQLVEAGLDVIGTHGWAATTVRAVCRSASLTERYFYEAFEERDQLLTAVYDRVVAEGVAVVMAAIEAAPRDFRKTVHAVITAGVDWVEADPRKGRLLTVEAAANEALQHRRQQAVRAQAALLATLSGQLFGTTRSEQDAMLNALSVVGSLVELGTAYLDGSLDIPRDRFIAHLTGIIVATAGVSSAN